MKSIVTTATKEVQERPFKKRMGFDQKNVEATSHLPIGQREYGFIRATKPTSPFPAAKGTMDTKSLFTRLRNVQAKTKQRVSSFRIVSASTSSSSSKIEKNLSKSNVEHRSTGTTAFQMKRKQFDEGEFTITRGQKLSELKHPGTDNGLYYHRDTQFMSYKEMEAFCRQMNIQIHKGFEATLY